LPSLSQEIEALGLSAFANHKRKLPAFKAGSCPNAVAALIEQAAEGVK
jgi:hypothetical protein